MTIENFYGLCWSFNSGLKKLFNTYYHFMKRIFKIAIIAIISFFLFAEVAQRVRYSIIYHDIKWILWGFTQNPHYRASNIKKKLENKLNSLGYRGEDFSREKPEEKKRIVCVGDSNTWGLENPEQSYPCILQTILGHNYEVINAGESGATLERCVSKLHSHLFRTGNFTQRLVPILELNPDVLILFAGVCDVLPTSFESITPSWYHIVLFKTLLYTTLREKFAFQKYKDYRHAYDRCKKLSEEDRKIFLERYRNDLLSFIYLSRLRNPDMRIIIVKIPYITATELGVKLAPCWDNVVCSLCEDTHFIVDDVSREFGIETVSLFNKKSSKKLFFNDDALHLNLKGLEAVAGKLAKKVKNTDK